MAYMTIDECAAELRCSEESVRRAVKDGLIKAMQIRGPGSAWRVDRRDFREYLTKARNDTEEAIVSHS